MKLHTLLDQHANYSGDIEVHGISLDSRKVAKGDVFFALAGERQQGMTFVNQAIENGAVAIVYEPLGVPAEMLQSDINVIHIPIKNLKHKLGEIAAKFYDDPSQQLDVIGVTGTNGKTTCSQFLTQLLPACGVIGTLGWGTWGQLNNTLNTTPDALLIQKILHQFVELQKINVVMEVSSHGLDQGRVNGIRFKGAVFTNISRDHLDYHGSMKEYVKAKLRLLNMPGLSFVVINLDDSYQQQVIAAVPEGCEIWRFSVKQAALQKDRTIHAENIEYGLQGVSCDVIWGGKQAKFTAPVFGEFNLQNILAVLATLLALGVSFKKAVEKLALLKPVAGRMECVQVAQGLPLVFIDYAHTPDALDKVLASLVKHSQQKLWLVFGCGGERDKGKRALMGQIAVKWTDKVTLTDDNPREENSAQIINDIVSGCGSKKVAIIQDRAAAIDTVIAQASKYDLVLIAGKGHEQYQEINGIKNPFNDRQVAEQALLARCA